MIREPSAEVQHDAHERPQGAVRLLLLRDRRPGHHNQVEGLARAIGQAASVTVDRIELRPRWLGRGVIRNAAFGLLARKNDHAKALRAMFGIDAAGLPKADAVIASGRAGFLAAVLMRRQQGGLKFVHCGHLPEYPRDECDLMLVSSPRVAFEPKCVLAPIPSVIDPDRLPQPRALRNRADLDGASFSLLVGGKAKGYRYTDADWQAVVDLVAATGAGNGIRWSVSTSRRTPDHVSDRFATLAGAGALHRFVDFRSTGPGSANDLYAADALVVTEDSRSMVAECIAARRPTIILRPAKMTFSAATEDIVAMAADGAAILPAGGLETGRFCDALLSVRRSTANPRAALVAAVAPVLGLMTTGQAHGAATTDSPAK